MKRLLCVLTALCLCLSMAACGASAPPAANTPAVDGPAPTAAAAATFPPAYLMGETIAETPESLVSECPDLACAGSYVWRYTYGAVLCADPLTGQTLASLPAAELTGAGAAAAYQSIVSWTDDSVLLVLASDSGEKHVELTELELRDGEIRAKDRFMADDKLGFLFDEPDQWLEIDMVSNGQRLFIAALDPEFNFRLYLYTPAEDTLVPLGERSLEVYIAAIPYGADMLVVGPNLEDEGILELTRLSLDDGSTELLESLALDSALEVFNFACSEEEELLLFTRNSIVYAYKLQSGEEPKPVGMLESAPAFFRLGVTAGERFVCHGETGQILSCSLHGELTVQPLRIISADGDETLSAAIRDFSMVYPQYAVSAVMSDGEENLLARTEAEDFDAYVVWLNSDVFRILRDKGMIAELTGSGLIDAVADNMPARLRAALGGREGMSAFPVRIDNYCQLLNVSAVEELCGITREKLPTDWTGFLKLLGRLAKEGTLIGNSRYCIFNTDVTAGEFRDTVFSWLMQDCFLWTLEDSSRIGRLEKTLVPILKEFNKIDWTRLGLPEDVWYEDDYMGAGGFDGTVEDKNGGSGFNMIDVSAGEESASVRKTEGPGGSPAVRTPLLTEAFMEIAVIARAEGDEYWPLSIETGGKRLMAQNVLVICANADTPGREAVRSFVEYLWARMDMAMKMTVCRTINEPVLNTNYEEDLAYYQQRIDELERKTAQEKNPAEKEVMNQQLRQMHAFLEQYRKNARWAVSEESIAAYRAMQDQLIPSPLMLWTDPSIDDAVYDFLDGLATPKQFARTLQALMTP